MGHHGERKFYLALLIVCSALPDRRASFTRPQHGGGYAYRLCSKDRFDAGEGESCFQENYLEFVGDNSWIDSESKGKHAIPAFRTRQTKGNNTWTRNPIPPWQVVLIIWYSSVVSWLRCNDT